ncbi:MAG: alpha-amylase family glycosyl hydrolase [Bacteroidales bacterium]|nr:alpha-amylase family glycosyl hydrolase [Bacteroidales bacterium]
MKYSLSLLAAVGVLSTSCSEKLNTTPANWERASVVTITCDSMVNYFTDYFPAATQFSELQPGEGLTLHGFDTETFALTTKKPLTTLKLKVDGEPATLVVEDTRVFKQDYWQFINTLYTTGYDKQQNALTLRWKGEKPAQVIALWQNQQLPAESVILADEEIVVKLPQVASSAKQRTHLRVYAATAERALSDVLVLLDGGKPVTSQEQLTRHDPETQILYSLMIDRFQNGNKANDWQYNKPEEVLPQADYQGGDIAGITQKIEDGFFQALGINTLWISPITQNPYDVWGQYHNPDTKFTGYHGYWPIYITKVEERFATDEELHHMLNVAHQHNMNVVLDYVANHLHINSPLFQAHPEWATDSITPDGRRNFELWDEFRLTTWFDVHIPSLNYEMQEVADQLTDSALFWVKNFEFDGFRHDACKHIPLNYWRTFTRKMKSDPALRNRDLWMIGETYGDADLIGSYIKTGMLNSQFDFNIYHTAIDVLGGNGSNTMRNIAAAVNESQWAYGAHHTMGNISGNHDKARFVSLAGGDLKWDEDAKAAGWNRHVGVGDSVRGYAKQLMLNKLNLTLPGVPCIYQGDEYGQEGGNDPDNRRFMRFDGYNRFEQHNLAEVKKFAIERRNSLPLQLGDYMLLHSSDTEMVFLRIYLGEAALVAVNNSENATDIEVEIPAGLKCEAGKRTLHVEGNDVLLIKL